MWKDHDPPDGTGIDFTTAPPPATLGEMAAGWLAELLFWLGWLLAVMLLLLAGAFFAAVNAEWRDSRTLRPTTVFEQEQPDEQQTHRHPRR